MIDTNCIRHQIELFLAEKRIAIVGISRNPTDFTRVLAAEFRHHGYEIVPVNPAADEIDGVRCYACVQDVPPPLRAVLVVTSAEVAQEVVRQCFLAGVKQVWLHHGIGPGAVSDYALAYCRDHGIKAIPGYCPLMFLKQMALIHRAHAFMTKLNGTYPN